MALFRVRYTGPMELEIEADGSVLAEIEAAEQTSENWIAEYAEDLPLEEDNG